MAFGGAFSGKSKSRCLIEGGNLSNLTIVFWIFSLLAYTPGPCMILDFIPGSVKPGQVMAAIMGTPGAEKSMFLDILARKGKREVVSGMMLVNGREMKGESG